MCICQQYLKDRALFHTHPDLLPAQPGPPQDVQRGAWTCPALLPLLPARPPSTSPPRPPLGLLTCLLPPWGWRPGFQPVLCSSSPPARVSKSPGGQTPHPSPSLLQASIRKRKIRTIKHCWRKLKVMEQTTQKEHSCCCSLTNPRDIKTHLNSDKQAEL